MLTTAIWYVILLQCLLFFSYLLCTLSQSLISHSLVRLVCDSTLINHIRQHRCHLLLWLISTESLNKLEFLIHIAHLLDCFVVWGLLEPSSRFIYFVLESLDSLSKLVSCLHWDCVSFVFIWIEYAYIVITRLVLFSHFSWIRLRFILDALMFSLDDPSDCFFLRSCLVKLVYVEIHLRQDLALWQIVWETD